MAITICKKHGRAHFTEICPHVAEHVERGSYGNFHYVHAIPSGLLVCDECLAKYDLGRFKDHPRLQPTEKFWEFFEIDDKLSDEFYEGYKRFTDRRTCCDECIEAAKLNQAKLDGRFSSPNFVRTNAKVPR